MLIEDKGGDNMARAKFKFENSGTGVTCRWWTRNGKGKEGAPIDVDYLLNGTRGANGFHESFYEGYLFTHEGELYIRFVLALDEWLEENDYEYDKYYYIEY